MGNVDLSGGKPIPSSRVRSLSNLWNRLWWALRWRNIYARWFSERECDQYEFGSALAHGLMIARHMGAPIKLVSLYVDICVAAYSKNGITLRVDVCYVPWGYRMTFDGHNILMW